MVAGFGDRARGLGRLDRGNGWALRVGGWGLGCVLPIEDEGSLLRPHYAAEQPAMPDDDNSHKPVFAAVETSPFPTPPGDGACAALPAPYSHRSPPPRA